MWRFPPCVAALRHSAAACVAMEHSQPYMEQLSVLGVIGEKWGEKVGNHLKQCNLVALRSCACVLCVRTGEGFGPVA